MNIIFLDIDGVLNSEESIVRFYEEAMSKGQPNYNCDEIFPKEYMNNLKELVEETDSKIVISSTWRMFYPDNDKWFKLMSNLKEYNLDTKVIDRTPYTSKKRGDEIRMWLSEHPEVSNFVIIDDDSDMCEFTETKLAKSSWKNGFTKEVKDKALMILKCISNADMIASERIGIWTK